MLRFANTVSNVNCGALLSGQRSHTRTQVFKAGCQCLYHSDWLIFSEAWKLLRKIASFRDDVSTQGIRSASINVQSCIHAVPLVQCNRGLVRAKQFLCFAEDWCSKRWHCVPTVQWESYCGSVRIFTSRKHPSLRALRAETRLTVYRALRRDS